MFEISQLKEKTLVDLQEIAKTIGAKKFSQLKKLDLVYLILDIQASAPSQNAKNPSNSKPKRARIKSNTYQKKKAMANGTSNEKKMESNKPVQNDQKKDAQAANPHRAEGGRLLQPAW